MAGPLSDKELGKRLSAGRGYARESITAFAERIEAGRQQLERWEKGDFGSEERPNTTERKRAQAIRQVGTAAELPEAFFTVDLQRLPDMERADRLVQVMTPSERATFEERALQKALADASEQSAPSDPHSTEPGA